MSFLDDIKVCWNSAEGEFFRQAFVDSVGVELNEPYLDDDTVTCMEKSTEGSKAILNDFGNEIIYVSQTLTVENSRDRFIGIEYKKAFDDLVKLRDEMIQKGICSKMPTGYQVPLESIGTLSEIKSLIDRYNRLPNEEYQQNILNIAEHKGTLDDYGELVFLFIGVTGLGAFSSDVSLVARLERGLVWLITGTVIATQTLKLHGQLKALIK